MKTYLSILFVTITLFFFTQRVFAQEQRTDSNEVQTKVGNPPVPVGNCPTATGIVSNGSLYTPVIERGISYGHCNAEYARAYPANCLWAGTKFAVDVVGNDYENVFLPKVNGNLVDWTYLLGYDEIKGSEAILKFSGIDSVSKEQYYLQLHHMSPGSGVPGKSGDVGGRICGGGCREGHVHVQIARGQNLASNSNWMDAGTQIVCKNYPLPI